MTPARPPMRALALALLLGALPALAPAAEAPAPRRAELAQVQGQDDGAPADDAPRRRPGRAPEADRVAPAMDPNAVPPPLPTVPREFIPFPDRWRLGDALGLTSPRVYDPYNPNVLKADRPIFGSNDYFFNLEAISDSLYEPRRL